MLEAITCKKTVDFGTVSFAVIEAGVLSLSCYGLRIPSRPSAVSCFLGRLMFRCPLSPNLRNTRRCWAVLSQSDALVGIDDVQKSLNRSRASVYRYNTDPRNLNPPFNPRKLNPEYRSDQKDPLLFHPNEVARFAKDVLRIKEVTVEVLNSPTAPSKCSVRSWKSFV